MMQVGQPVMGKMSSYVQINHGHQLVAIHVWQKSVKSSSHFPVPEVKPCYPATASSNPWRSCGFLRLWGGLNERTVASFCMRRTTLIDKYVYKCISIYKYIYIYMNIYLCVRVCILYDGINKEKECTFKGV